LLSSTPYYHLVPVLPEKELFEEKRGPEEKIPAKPDVWVCG